MIPKLYAIPTYHCNLSCKHCNIKDVVCKEDFDAFVNALSQVQSNAVVLFGGEPLSISDTKFTRVIETNKIDAISTNLLLLSRMHLELIRKHDISIATSWNPTRFSIQQYQLWLNNIKMLIDNCIYVTVLITLTDDLFESSVLDVLHDLDQLRSKYFRGVKFEPYVVSTESLIEKADNWLVDLHKTWKYNYRCMTFEDYADGNFNLCKGIMSILPDGKCVSSCPTMSESYFIDNCLKCKYNKICIPCKKQKICTFFRKLYNEVKQYGNG